MYSDIPLLKVSHLGYKTKQGEKLIDDISFNLGKGENLVIIGPNGSGKSTLLKMIAGILTPTSGQVFYDKTPLHQLSLKQRASKIAFISQSEQPDSRLLVKEYVRLGCIPHESNLSQQEITDQVDRAMCLLGVSHLLNKTMLHLSGGERQKVYIARSLCQKPDILLLDEPTNHLDPKAKGEVLSNITSLGISTITVLHELSLAAQMCDKLLLLDQATAKAFGAPDKILTQQQVTQVFGVGFHRFEHPQESRELVCLDIPLKKKPLVMELQ
ncbi:ABC transporter ATP-binding protein [Vibrio sonorensis]|uniref:ABC transporter ATP-binding protein n=1 Tax=Vibrio sonorensis TaxID=1004316 RepID=UPI0008DB152E|nr:ABC transporter ATP-binding protein [Vibrio sonorensis]